MKIQSLFFSVLFCIPLNMVEAKEPTLIPRSVLFGNPEKASPKISHDGKYLAYVAPDSKGVLNVWLRTIGQNDDHTITHDTRRGIRTFYWQGDSKHILYPQDQEGNENFHFYQTEIDTKNTRDLTPFQDVKAQIIAYELQYKDEMIVSLNLRDRHLFDVYHLDLNTGALEMVMQNGGDVEDWMCDHDLQVRACLANKADGSTTLRLYQDKSKDWRDVLSCDYEEEIGLIGFTADNKNLLMQTTLGCNAKSLVELDAASLQMHEIVSDAQYDVDSVIMHPTTHRLEAVSFEREKLEWQMLDKTFAERFATAQKKCKGVINLISRDEKDEHWIFSDYNDTAPIKYYLYDAGNDKAEYLFSSRPQLEKYTLAPMQPIQFQARDGMTIYGYLTLPVGHHKNVPMILNVHGGPAVRETWGYNPEAQWMANRGYAVLQINYRGSAGYGKKYLHAGDREWGGRMHDDLIDGKRWAIAQGYADPNCVAIFGGSYGGYATLVGLAFTPEEFVCGVDIVGPSNLVSLIRTVPPYWKLARPTFDRRIGNIDTEEEFVKSRSPLFKVDAITKPLLIAQGANDPRVKQSESDQMVEQLRKNGKEVKYLLFPDEGHGFARPENRQKFYAAAEQFFAQYMHGRAQPPSPEEDWTSLLK